MDWTPLGTLSEQVSSLWSSFDVNLRRFEPKQDKQLLAGSEPEAVSVQLLGPLDTSH